MDDLKLSPPNSCPLTLLSFLDRATTVYSDCISIIYNSTSYTWSQTHRRCLQLASSISSLRISPGHVVSVLAPNIPAMYELHFAVPMDGAVLNTINILLDSRTISTLLRHSKSQLLFIDFDFISVALDAVSLFPLESKQPMLVLIPEISATVASPLQGRYLGTYEEMVGKGETEFTWIKFTWRWWEKEKQS